MKWLIGVGLVVASPLIISGILLYLLIWKLPLIVYAIAHDIYEHMTEKKHEGIGWYNK